MLIMEKTLKMLKYILSLSLLFSFVIANAQNIEEEESNTQEEKKEPKKPGLSIGLNIGTFIVTAIEPERIGLEATVRYRFNRKFFAVGELGYENVSFDREPLQYESNGSFLRIGGDYNIFNVDEIGNNDNLILGLRYGVALTEYSSNRFTIKDDYWGDYTNSLGSDTSNAHWAEVVLGLRSEILKNFYMGWSVRIRQIIALNQSSELEPYAIPGYGRRDNTTNLSFTYNLEYHFPFSK